MAKSPRTSKSTTKRPSKKADSQSAKSASDLVSAKITSLGDWRGDVLQRVRKLIKEADPQVIEEMKWAKASNPTGVPVWSHDGMICTGETYKDTVKLTFARGAALKDPGKLFNSSLDGNLRRAIDIHKSDKIDESAFKDLIRAAIALNMSAKKK